MSNISSSGRSSGAELGDDAASDANEGATVEAPVHAEPGPAEQSAQEQAEQVALAARARQDMEGQVEDDVGLDEEGDHEEQARLAEQARRDTQDEPDALAPESRARVERAAQAVEAFFEGKPVEVKTNQAGDKTFQSEDRQFRMDILNPGGDDPHFHVKEKKTPGGKYKDATPEHRHYFDGDDEDR
jgi:hypothetical protein